MAFLIGTDEAGYGPNLGPLVIAASVWHVPGDDCDVDLYQSLSPWITSGSPSTSRSRSGSPRHADKSLDTTGVTRAGDELPLCVADSKQVYRPGAGLQGLERGVLSAAAALFDTTANDWLELLAQLCPDAASQSSTLPWHQRHNPSIPTAISPQQLAADRSRWRQLGEATGIRLVALRAAMIFPEDFNRDVARLNSKGLLLSETTLDLVADCVTPLSQEPIRIVCDKHGGRNHYGALLQSRFNAGLVRVATEGRQLSQYDVGTSDQPIEIRFQVGGESFMPSALASMTAKYLRELAMAAFNAFWQEKVAGLRPTAGYPVDALRFRHDIEHQRRSLRIPLETLWRDR